MFDGVGWRQSWRRGGIGERERLEKERDWRRGDWRKDMKRGRSTCR
jgi:hypothetical protein